MSSLVFKKENGQALLLVLIAMVFGSLAVGSFLTLASTSLKASSKNTDLLWARYAAEAGVNAVNKDLIQGINVLTAGYTTPAFTLNDHSPSVILTTPSPGTEPAGSYQYVDPGASKGLKTLGGQTHYYITIDNVKANTNIRANWDFTPNDKAWKIFLYSGLGPPGAPAPTIIATDNFESGNFSGGAGWLAAWSASGLASIATSGSPKQGSYHMLLESSTGHAQRNLNLSGRTDVRVQFWAKAVNFNPGDNATLSVSPDGISFTIVRTWTSADADSIYRYEDIDISSFSMTTSFYIAFDANMSGGANDFYVDDLKIVSQPVPAPLLQNTGVVPPAGIFVSGGIISGGQYTLDFFNNSDGTITSKTYSSTGGSAFTWVHLQAYKDHIISSTAGSSNIKVFARQFPGPTNPITRQNVFLHTWVEP